MLLLSSLIFSCKKGDTGPEGPEGQQGEMGVPGPNGSQIFKGSGAPALTLGANGDFYLDMNTTNFYGPKTETGWGTPLLLAGATGPQGPQGPQGPAGPQGPQGNTGAAGANGKTILTGTGVPAANIGTTGDYFLDRNTYNFYGPKDGSGWNAPVSLKGPKGDPGTANVIYSGWRYATSFNDSTIDNSSLKVGYLTAPALTPALLNTSLIQVYFTYGGGNFTLPYTSNAGGKPNTISYTPMSSKILITRFTHDNSNSVNLSTLLQYRYLIIPGGIAANAAKNKIDLEDYSATMKFLEIPE